MADVMITDPENQPITGECPNCSADLSGPFCSNCGQRQVDLDRPLSDLGAEAMDAFFSFDTRILCTLWPLISRPGFLTVEFMAGRRKRYVHPFKLYFAICVALFVVLAFSGRSMVTISDSDETVIASDATDATDQSGGGVEVGTDKVGAGDELAPGASGGIPLADSEDDDSLLSRVFTPLREVSVNDPDRLNRVFSDRLAKTIIILVPVFALLLRALYRRRSYITEFVFSLHLHSFAFLALIAGTMFDLAVGASGKNGPGGAAAVLAIAVYTFLALRRVQRQGRLLTVAKMVVLMVGYVVALIITMIMTLALTALFL